jgi:hypothetical protein
LIILFTNFLYILEYYHKIMESSQDFYAEN